VEFAKSTRQSMARRHRVSSLIACRRNWNQPIRETPGHGPRPYREQRTDDRFAVWLRRLRWPVVLLWLIAIVLLNPLSSSLSKVENNTAAALLPPAAQSTRAMNIEQAAAKTGTDDTAVVVFARSSGPSSVSSTAGGA
jgi:hypothetical protein